ncbi:MAG TPA: CoA-binding protein [Casimicrobiaceae bacterium]
MTVRNLDYLLRPRSVALIGASDREHSVGTAVMRNLLDGGFRGPIFPVHATRRSVAGVHAYRDVGSLPQTPDLAVICTPPDSVADLVRALGIRGTRAVAILTDGVPHEPVLDAARPRLVRILGPDSMGLLVPGLGLNASFAPTPAQPGSLAFVSQSGALLAAALDWAATRRIGFTHAVSLGNAADVDTADVLDFLGGDTATRAILVYVESVRSGRKFLSAARAAARGKPLIVMKAGRTRVLDGRRARAPRGGRAAGGGRAGVRDPGSGRAGFPADPRIPAQSGSAAGSPGIGRGRLRTGRAGRATSARAGARRRPRAAQTRAWCARSFRI